MRRVGHPSLCHCVRVMLRSFQPSLNGRIGLHDERDLLRHRRQGRLGRGALRRSDDRAQVAVVRRGEVIAGEQLEDIQGNPEHGIGDSLLCVNRAQAGTFDCRPNSVPGPTCGDVEQSPIEPPSGGLASVEFDPIHIEAEVSDKDRRRVVRALLRATRSGRPTHHHRVWAHPSQRSPICGRSRGGWDRPPSSRSQESGGSRTHPLIPAAQPVCIGAPQEGGNAPEIGSGRHGDVGLDRARDLVGRGPYWLRHAQITVYPG